MKAYCRNCVSVTEHRFCVKPIQELVCNKCHSIAVTFHDKVILQKVVGTLPDYQKLSGCHLCQSDPCQCGAC